MNKLFEKFKKKNETRVNKVSKRLRTAGELYQDFIRYLIKQFLNNSIEFYKSEIFQRNFGEGPDGCEIKVDNRCTGYGSIKGGTGNLSIEYAKYYRIEKNSDIFYWMDSGIFNHAKLKYYIQGNPDLTFIFERETLVKLFNLYKNDYDPFFTRKEYFPDTQWNGYDPKLSIEEIDEYPLKSFLLSLPLARRLCIGIFENINDEMTFTRVDNNIDDIFEELKNEIIKNKNDIFEFEKELWG